MDEKINEENLKVDQESEEVDISQDIPEDFEFLDENESQDEISKKIEEDESGQEKTSNENYNESIDSIVESISKANNIPSGKVKKYTEDWVAALMEKGVVVKLEINRWRANSGVNPDEIGVDSNNPNYIQYQQDYLSLGTKKLLPKKILKEISKIEGKARKNLKDHSIKTVWGLFVPHSSFEDWKKKDDEIRKEFFLKAQSIADIWTDLQKEVCENYNKFLLSTIKGKGEDPDYEDKIKVLMSDFKDDIINADDFLKSFEYETFFFYIPLPSILQNDIYKKDQIEAKRKQMKTEVEMNKKIMEATLEKRTKHIDDFYQSISSKLSETTLRIINDVKKAIENDGEKEIGTRDRKRLTKAINTIRSFDIFHEDKVLKALEKLEIDLNKSGDEKKTLNDIKDSVDSFEVATKGMLHNWLNSKIENSDINKDESEEKVDAD